MQNQISLLRDQSNILKRHVIFHFIVSIWLKLSIKKLGAPVASIGGAGTFDGIFFTGVLAVLLA